MVDEGSGKIFPRPKTFREVAPALALAREVAESICFRAIFAHQDSKGYYVSVKIILIHGP